jgi:putative transposase
MSIDLGINNLATILISNSQPIIIDEKKAKSVNSRFNYKIAKLKSQIDRTKNNNKIFYGIPHSTLIDYITYKAKTMGIKVILQEETYTSKCDALAFETIKKQDKYLGKRIKRGLFQSSTGKLINADVNAAINILSKYLNKYKQDFYLIVNKILSKGFVFNPVRLRLI